MFLKKTKTILVPTEEDTIPVSVKLSEEEAKAFENLGLQVIHSKVVRYRLPARYLGSFLTFVLIFLQDLLNFKIFNSTRKYVYYTSLSMYDVELTDKQKEYLQNYNKDE